MSAHIVVTHHEHEDFLHLVALVDDEYYQMFGEIALEYRKHNKTESLADVVLVYMDGKPAACGGLREYDADTVEIKRVFVQKAYRRRGLATLLMDKLEEIAKQKGHSRAILQTGSMMQPAIGLYRSLGYEMIKNYGAFDGDEHVACMQKAL